MAPRFASALLVLHPMLAVAWATAVSVRLAPARADGVWTLAALPIAAMALGPRTRGRIALAAFELATLVPLHAWITLLRAARLEGG